MNNTSKEIHGFYIFFFYLAEFFRSLAVVICIMLGLVVFQTFETQEVFYWVLKEGVGESHDPFIPSLLIAIIFECSQLVFTSNKDSIVHRYASYTLAGISFLINIFYFQAWVGTVDVIAFKVFASALFAYLHLVYADLFLKKRNELAKRISVMALYKRVAGDLQELKVNQQILAKEKQRLSEQKTTLKELEVNRSETEQMLQAQKQTLREVEQSFSEKNQRLQEIEALLEQLLSKKGELDALISKHTCEVCEGVFPTIQSKNGHRCNRRGKKK